MTTRSIAVLSAILALGAGAALAMAQGSDEISVQGQPEVDAPPPSPGEVEAQEDTVEVPASELPGTQQHPVPVDPAQVDPSPTGEEGSHVPTNTPPASLIDFCKEAAPHDDACQLAIATYEERTGE